jgi:hypothetical protein
MFISINTESILQNLILFYSKNTQQNRTEEEFLILLQTKINAHRQHSI